MTRATYRRPAGQTPTRALSRLAELRLTFGGDAAAARLAALRSLEARPLRSVQQVVALHEVLCFIRAYPDNQTVFDQVSAMLACFGQRPDLARFRHRLENSGIAGTDLVYPFAAATARWLADRWPAHLTVAWDRGETRGVLETRLPHLTAWAERAVFDEPPLAFEAWLDHLRGPHTDATFLVQRSAAVTGTSLLGDQLYDELELTLRVSPGPGTPSRSLARAARRHVDAQAGPLRSGRPDLMEVVNLAPRHVVDVSRREAERLIDLARVSMVTRKRDLYTFAAADPRDVRLIDCGDGLEFVCYGVRPEQRLLLEAVYGFLMLRNGVPVGYALASALWRSAEIAFNTFDTFRGGETAWVYSRLLAIMRALFGVDTFAIYPYQLGHDNEEGLTSGAWWFYYKMGFRPKAPDTAALARQESERVAQKRGYRTNLATLKRLVRSHLFFHLGPERTDVIGALETDRIALAATDVLGRRGGPDREHAAAGLADEAARTYKAGAWRQWPAGERLAWERWGSVLALLGDVSSWSADERAALVEVVRAKGSAREGDFVTRFDAHPRLGRAIVAMATG